MFLFKVILEQKFWKKSLEYGKLKQNCLHKDIVILIAKTFYVSAIFEFWPYYAKMSENLRKLFDIEKGLYQVLTRKFSIKWGKTLFPFIIESKCIFVNPFTAGSKTSDNYRNGTILDQCCSLHNVIWLGFRQVESR